MLNHPIECEEPVKSEKNIGIRKEGKSHNIANKWPLVNGNFIALVLFFAPITVIEKKSYENYCF